MVQSPDGDASPGVGGGKTPLQKDVEDFLRDKGVGNTVRNYSSQLDAFLGWLDGEHGIGRVDEIDSTIMAGYARRLAGKVADEEIAGATAHTYYDYVSAFLHWCVGWEKIGQNPARAFKAIDALPENRGHGDQQFWSPKDRQQLLSYVDKRAHDSLDGTDHDRRQAFRDRALVYVLALTGARGAEVFQDPADDARPGLRWRDVDLEGGRAAVLGKSRETEMVPLPSRVVEALDRLRRVREPPSEDWPLFPTMHRPTLAQLGDGEAPPAITVGGARRVMKGICREADLAIDGEYLKPHGGRRGIGGALYRENAAFAQKLLRHKSLETTNETYEDIQAGEVAEKVDELLGGGSSQA